MQFIFPPNRSEFEERVLRSSLKRQWAPSDVIPEHQISPYKTEYERLKWAQVLISLAFGESTAFAGFGTRISDATDISTKVWLSLHLLDEGRHAEAFTRILNYLYPTYINNHQKLFSNRYAYIFYGNTERTLCLTKWLICTQMAEVFGKECYKQLLNKLGTDPVIGNFLRHIISDESHHVAYIRSLIENRRVQTTKTEWKESIEPFIEVMLPHCRNMFEARRKGAIYHGFESLEIDVSTFCDIAESELKESFFN